MTDELSRRTFVAGAGVAGVIVLMGREVYHEQKAIAAEFVEQCDEEYGEDNWTMVPANQSEWDRRYIGDQHVCVAEDSERAEAARERDQGV